MNILIPMLGSSSIFEENGYKYPKSLIEIKDIPLIQHVYENLKDISNSNFIYIIDQYSNIKYNLKNVLQLMDPKSKIIVSESETMGAACTALLAINEIDNNSGLIIANCDQLINVNLNQIVDDFISSNFDAATIIFDSLHPKWSSVKLDVDNLVIEASEKKPISKNATAGFYYFKKGSYFVKATENMIRKNAVIDGKFYICPTFNELILDSKKIGVSKIERSQYINFTSPKDIEKYESNEEFK